MSSECLEERKDDLYISLGNTKKLTYTIPEVAEKLNISVAHAYKLANQNAFPTIRLGKRILVGIRKLEEFINQ